jgi:hypothetical protein
VSIKFLKVEYLLAEIASVIRGIGANIILMLKIIFIASFCHFHRMGIHSKKPRRGKKNSKNARKEASYLLTFFCNRVHIWYNVHNKKERGARRRQPQTLAAATFSSSPATPPQERPADTTRAARRDGGGGRLPLRVSWSRPSSHLPASPILAARSALPWQSSFTAAGVRPALEGGGHPWRRFGLLTAMVRMALPNVRSRPWWAFLG